MTCALTISTSRSGQLGHVSGLLGEDFGSFGPWRYAPIVAPGEVQNADGSYEDTLSLRFECRQIRGRPGPRDVLAEVDSVEIAVAV